MPFQYRKIPQELVQEVQSLWWDKVLVFRVHKAFPSGEKIILGNMADQVEQHSRPGCKTDLFLLCLPRMSEKRGSSSIWYLSKYSYSSSVPSTCIRQLYICTRQSNVIFLQNRNFRKAYKSQYLSNPDQLVIIIMAMEERLLPEDHGSQHTTEAPHVQADGRNKVNKQEPFQNFQREMESTNL